MLFEATILVHTQLYMQFCLLFLTVLKYTYVLHLYGIMATHLCSDVWDHFKKKEKMLLSERAGILQRNEESKRSFEENLYPLKYILEAEKNKVTPAPKKG